MDLQEIPLSGGRTTQGVVRRGEVVLRPQCEHGELVHQVLEFLEGKGVKTVPRFLGIDEKGREMLSLLPGSCPDNIGIYTEEQILAGVDLILELHQVLAEFPLCGPGQTVCHYDLSPCNFLFTGEQPPRTGEMKTAGLPAYVIDWDACAVGDPLDDLAYACWLWLDFGCEERELSRQAGLFRSMLDRYGLDRAQRKGFLDRVEKQMLRVEQSRFPTEERTQACRSWTQSCRRWLRKNESVLEQALA